MKVYVVHSVSQGLGLLLCVKILQLLLHPVSQRLGLLLHVATHAAAGPDIQCVHDQLMLNPLLYSLTR